MNQPFITLASEIMKNIALYPDEVNFEIKEDETNNILVTINANKEDIGKLIGRDGSTIQSLQLLMRKIANKNKIKISFTVNDQR